MAICQVLHLTIRPEDLRVQPDPLLAIHAELANAFRKAAQGEISLLIKDDVHWPAESGRDLLWQLDDADERVNTVAINPLPLDAKSRVGCTIRDPDIHPLPRPARASTPVRASQVDLLLLAERTAEYTASDIACLARDALMQPVRTVMAARHFAVRSVEDVVCNWAPCAPHDVGAVPMSWDEIGLDEIEEQTLTVEDFLWSIDAARPTVGEKWLKWYVDWFEESRSSLFFV
ncbi:hypothetical protein C8R44DRAFT_885875 [Mycena epipterygia]|nr:hypothetical protein C8R44DRAFT_885875 [Mycena epipterygia]